MSTTMAPQSVETDRDDIFYVDTIVFKVENTLFRVPRCGFEVPGCFFATMFTLPGPGEKGEQIEGTDDAHPILLEGIQKSHFKSFLKVLYPKLYKCLPAAGVPYDETYERQDGVNTYDDWIGVLHLSTKWDFPKIRKTSIESVSRCMPTYLSMYERISLAKKYNVKKWLLDEYRKLVQKATLDFDVPILMLQSCMTSSDIVGLFLIRERTPIQVDVDKLILARFVAHFAGMEDD
ncbi:hypothetical protein D9613_001096 [Agrocybe pediades]|uniref:BTB domain-containing protein n=1 Tax=Agrocybe pediades TaxID=84607 RepID=A0A8H4R2B6_9AGAR|nr:hypothetical protein D9613_001096 [Agrocybe pediades]